MAHSICHFDRPLSERSEPKGKRRNLCIFRRSATVLLLATATLTAAHAQSDCGARLLNTTTKLVYPPIARAAHVSGNVILLATFAHDGSVSNIKTISGPLMLQGSAIDYVKGWQVNKSQGSRECPVVISFISGGNPPNPQGTITIVDGQHVEIRALFPATETSLMNSCRGQ